MRRFGLIVGALVLGVFLLACSVPPDLRLPSLLATPTPTVTPSPTTTPTLTPSPTPTPTPTFTPTPTPSPAQRLAGALGAIHEGKYERAVQIYQDLLALPVDQQVVDQARFGLGTAYLRQGAYPDAVETFNQFLASSKGAPGGGEQAQEARFLLADALVGAGNPLAAAEEYRAYLSGGTVITAYVNQSLGNTLYVGGDHPAAVEAYQAAISEAPDRSFEVYTREKLALVHVALEDYPAAIDQYDAILAVAQIESYRARIEHQTAETLILAGETEAGYARHLTVVETYPTAYYAYLSLVSLVEAGRPVDDFLRGKVDYYGGAYGPAVGAFQRYISAYPDTHLADAHWYAGLSYLEAGSPGLAAGEFRLLIDTHPDSWLVGDAWMGLAQAYADQGETDLAVEAYRTLAEEIPDHRRAPEALWRVARLLERVGDLPAAVSAYLDCQAQYPDSSYGPQALFRSGLLSYQEETWADAALAWETLAGVYADSAHRPAALLLLAKLRLRQGDTQAAGVALEQAQAADPWGYYGLRAADLVADPLAVPFEAAPYVPDYDPAGDQAEAEAWLAGWLGLEDATNLAQMSPYLLSDPRLQRGLALWQLGRFEEGKGELETVREATASDALAQYQLALAYRDIGLYRSSILCARRVEALSPAGSILEVPPFVARLIYPTYYEDLVLENARENKLAPLLVFALIRQESLFEGIATSSAAAHGLMQVIPDTGAFIAAELDWPPDYETSDLYRPHVSLRFGTYYLAQQRDRMDGRLDGALAGYNGGPGNARRWLDAAGGDPDLFLEMIAFDETRLYLKRIKEHLEVYEILYGGG